ncbi:MAG: LCP family protein [Firmicutes bacterium]|jgi:LCP family protein required for cell wall assembly|nr:LCP family protein [Bacillota bacterium]NLO65441.1 LCP family protein [Bacillota bacterium]
MLTEEEVLQRRAELEKRRLEKKKFRRRQIIVYTLLVVAAIILMFITGWYSYRRGLETLPVSSTGEQRLLILFLGTDDFLEASVRADTILLFSVNPRTGEAGVLSIPRDTRVWIPSRQSWDRVNAAYAHGGPEMALEAVSNLINAPVKYYVQTDFQGFETMVDLLGGVEIEIKKEMRYVEKARDLNIHFLPGKQLLNGEDALKYVRYRDSLGDVSLVDPFNEQYDGRVERQRQFFEALVDKVLSPSSLPKLPRLVSQAFRIVDTNVPWELVLELSLAANKFSADKIQTGVLPGNSGQINDAWYWLVDAAKAQRVIKTLVWGEPEPLRLTVLNGSGRSGIAGQVGDLLTEYGYNVVSRDNADHFNYQQTKILVSARDSARVEPLAEFLGAQIETADVTPTEVTVIIGRDYNITR